MSQPVPHRLRILLISRRSAPAKGGVESFLRHVSTGLAREHDVTLLTQRIDNGPGGRLTDTLRPPPSFEPFEDAGVSIAPLRLSQRERLRTAPTVLQVIPGIRRHAYGRLRVPMAQSYSRVAVPLLLREAHGAPDLVHVWADGFLALAGVQAAARTGVPAIVTPFVHAGHWGDDPASARAYRQAGRVIGLLEHDCDVLRRLGVAPERAVEVPPCSPGVQRGLGTSWRKRFEVEGPLILFLGVRRPYKGFDLLRDSLPHLARGFTGATVAFAGPGERVASTAMRVIDRGIVSEQERAALLEAADVLCLPSASEIFPVTILEAWSAGTAVLTSDIPTLAELMRRSAGGLAVPREPEAIALGLAEILGGRQHDLAAAGHRYWREHATVEAVVERHLNIYDEVLAERHGLRSRQRVQASA